MFAIIYSPKLTTPSAAFDLKKKRFISNLLGLGSSGSLYADLAHFECHGYKAAVANLDKLPRNTRGNIEAKAVLTRLSIEALQALLAKALKSRAQKAQGAALPLRGGLTPANRHLRSRIVTDDMVSKATQLRAEGHPWRIIASSFGIGISAIKWAHRQLTTARELRKAG